MSGHRHTNQFKQVFQFTSSAYRKELAAGDDAGHNAVIIWWGFSAMLMRVIGFAHSQTADNCSRQQRSQRTPEVGLSGPYRMGQTSVRAEISGADCVKAKSSSKICRPGHQIYRAPPSARRALRILRLIGFLLVSKISLAAVNRGSFSAMDLAFVSSNSIGSVQTVFNSLSKKSHRVRPVGQLCRGLPSSLARPKQTKSTERRRHDIVASSDIFQLGLL